MNQHLTSEGLTPPAPPRKSLAERVTELERYAQVLREDMDRLEELLWRHSHASDGSGVLGNDR